MTEVTKVNEIRSFCRICIANCGIVVHVADNQVVKVEGDADHPISRGYVCPKGRALGTAHHSDRRLVGPFVRRNGRLESASVDDAIDHTIAALRRVIDEHGVESVGTFMGSGGFIDPAASSMLRRLQTALGITQLYSTASVDSVAKGLATVLMSGTTALVPHPDEHGTLMLLVGSNPVVSHGQSTGFANPIERIRAAKARGEVYVVDPRVTETAQLADHHLAARPATDHVLLAHLVRAVLARGADPALTERTINLPALAAAVAPYDLQTTAARTGLDTTDIERLVASVVRAGRLAVVTGTGTTMSPTGNLVEWMAWALMIVTGSFDQPGGMWFNPGQRTRIDRRDRLPRARTGDPGAPSRPDIARLQGEWPASLIPAEIEAGRLRALVVLGCNVVTALPDTARVRAALGALDALVVFEVDHTDTTDLATHVIATADQLERPDVLALDMFAAQFYDQFTPAVVEAPAGRPPGWQSIARLASGLGHDLLAGAEINTTTSIDVLGRMSRSSDLTALRAADGPLVEATAMYGWVESRLPDGHWDLAPESFVAQLTVMESEVAQPNSLVLTPRRQVRHMNSQPYRDGDTPLALIHPLDATLAGVSDGDLINVASQTGCLTMTAHVTELNVQGSVSVPHGWADTNVNNIISAADLDPLSGMPRMSGTAVAVTRRAP
jgi:anaerobic selenocysteine-containing dehydrogenase